MRTDCISPSTYLFDPETWSRLPGVGESTVGLLAVYSSVEVSDLSDEAFEPRDLEPLLILEVDQGLPTPNEATVLELNEGLPPFIPRPRS